MPTCCPGLVHVHIQVMTSPSSVDLRPITRRRWRRFFPSLSVASLSVAETFFTSNSERRSVLLHWVLSPRRLPDWVLARPEGNLVPRVSLWGGWGALGTRFESRARHKGSPLGKKIDFVRSYCYETIFRLASMRLHFEWREDMNFIFEWWKQYCFHHEKIKFIFSSCRVIVFLLYRQALACHSNRVTAWIDVIGVLASEDMENVPLGSRMWSRMSFTHGIFRSKTLASIW